jgi:hypothetical protein
MTRNHKKQREKPPQGEEASKTNLRKVKKWSQEKAQKEKGFRK